MFNRNLTPQNIVMPQIPPRAINSQGLNIPASQHTSVPSGLKHETVIIPSTSQPSWGSYFVFDFKEKALTLHNITLQFNVSAIGGLPGGTSLRYTTAYQWFNRIEIVINNQVIDTIYPEQQFLLNNLFVSDEKRTIVNTASGSYSNPTQRISLALGTTDYYVNLWTFFNQSHLSLLYPKDDLQLRVYMDTFVNNFAYSTLGTGNTTANATSTINFANLICSITRLNSEVNSSKMLHLSKQIEHYKFSELRYGTFASNAGGTNYTYVLNSIVGKVDYLIFVVRNTALLNQDNQFRFNQILNFSILDSSSTNITGGQALASTYALTLLSKDWVQSTYLTESANNSNAYLYSFGADPTSTAKAGASFNHWHFQGNEQLQIQFASATTAAFQVDLYAHIQAAIEVAPSYVKKITL